MFLARWSEGKVRKPRSVPGTGSARWRQWSIPRPLWLEQLEERNLLSTSIPLNIATWTPLGPAPNVNLDTDFTENVTGRIAAVAAHPTDPNILYIAAAGGGVWKTTNANTLDPLQVTWTPLTDTQATLFMGAITVAPSNPDIIYAGTGEANLGPSKTSKFRDNIYYGRGVLRSTDAGATWTLLPGNVGQNEFDRRTISKIVVDPIDPRMVYVAVGARASNGLSGHTGIWKSLDGGDSWKQMVSGMTLTDQDAISDLVMDPFDPQHLYAAVGTPTVGGSPANGLYETVDGGVCWSPRSDPLVSHDERMGRITLAISSRTPGELFAAIAHSGNSAGLLRMVKTTDGGSSWSLVHRPPGNPTYLGESGDYHNTLALDPADDRYLYAGGEEMIESLDRGDSWNINFAPGDTDGPHHDHHGIAFDALGRLLDGNDGGIWRWDRLAGRWANLNGNLQITQFVAIALHPTDPDIAFGGAQDNGMLRFRDSLQWQRLERADGGAIAINGSDPRRVYHLRRTGTSATDHLFFRRTDNALDDQRIAWSTHVNGLNPADNKNFYLPFVRFPGGLAPGEDRLVLGTDKVYRTSNGGTSWTPISAPGMNGWPADVTDNIDSLAVAPSDETSLRTVYVTAGGHVLVSFNANAVPASNVRWQPIEIPGFADHFNKLLVDPTTNLIVYAVRDRFTDGPGGHVFQGVVSPDLRTISWTDISGDLPDLPTYSIALDSRFNPYMVYVGSDSGVYASSDAGASWSRFQTGLPNVQVADLELNTNLDILAAGTHGRGMWQILIMEPPSPSSRNSVAAANWLVLPDLLSLSALGTPGDMRELVATLSPASAEHLTQRTQEVVTGRVFTCVETETDRAKRFPSFVPSRSPGDRSLDALFSAWTMGDRDEGFPATGVAFRFS